MLWHYNGVISKNKAELSSAMFSDLAKFSYPRLNLWPTETQWGNHLSIWCQHIAWLSPLATNGRILYYISKNCCYAWKQGSEEVWFLCTKVFVGLKKWFFPTNLQDQATLEHMLATPCTLKTYYIFSIDIFRSKIATCPQVL